MKINWKVRFKNKVWLTAFLVAVIAFVYQILGIIGITPPITQDTLAAVGFALIDLLVMVGVVVDPTTPEFGDSERALGYTVPGGTEEEKKG